MWSRPHPRWERVSEPLSWVPAVQHAAGHGVAPCRYLRALPRWNQPMPVARRFHRRGISVARSQWRFSDRGVRSYNGRPACPACCKELV